VRGLNHGERINHKIRKNNISERFELGEKDEQEDQKEE
jgi:hypothetical protein